ncbi:hypothetical protein [Desnuesiella massiliensis]|uniref:hypothetical protein n=1 Tax=Desnuesiella massiliensis TaxID=1650662 RepID=UPI0006E24F9D|nr:hypothetical protein [Desnuesiella massiliensis]
MNKIALVKFGENLLQMIKSEGRGGDASIKSINDCILGNAIIKVAISEIESSVLQVMESMNAMAKERLLVRGVDFNTIIDADRDYVLRINYGKFFDKFMDYCKERGVPHPIFTLKEFKTLLRTQSYCKEYNWPTQFYCKAESYVYKKLYRAAILKIHDLKGLGIDIDYLIEE